DFGGQSPLCAPCAMRDIKQKKNRERNVFGSDRKQPFCPNRINRKLIIVSCITVSIIHLPGLA
ncbi:hypothetical protein, partial [Klebsiella aerogenes]|uniref:hypothetical protein n=1 Tax=Klebsiella aerogenes TaxID=548 RepID=UPI001CE24058